MNRFSKYCAAFAGLMLLGSPAAQADYPERPVTLMVPFGAGGSTDLPVRVLATAMEKILGQAVVVENLPGGGGAVGLGKLYNTKPDGYYIGVGTGSNMTIAPHAVDVAYDTTKFSYIGKFFAYPFVLVANPSLPVKDVNELLAYGKANPGALIMSTSGGFGIHDIGMSLMSEHVGGIDYRTLPNSGSAATITRMLAGDANVTFVSPALSLEHIKAGKLTALAIMSDVSTPQLDELNIRHIQDDLGFSTKNNAVLIAPPGLPDAIRQKLEDAMEAALSDPAVKAQIAGLGFPVNFLNGADTAKETAEVFDLYGKVTKQVLAARK